MSYSMIGVQKRRTRKVAKAAFMNAHGIDTIKSVSLSPVSYAGEPYGEVPEGTVLAWNHGAQRWVPCARDTVKTATTSSNIIPVNNSTQFMIGDVVFIAGTGPRTVTAVNDSTSTITVDGSALSLSAGVVLTVESYRGISKNQTTGTVTAIVVDDATPFKVGDVITVGADTSLTVSAVNYETNTLTIPSTAVAAGEYVFTQNSATAVFQVMCETARAYDYDKGAIATNVFAQVRPHGEARRENLIGLLAEAETYLRNNGMTFNNTSW